MLSIQEAVAVIMNVRKGLHDRSKSSLDVFLVILFVRRKNYSPFEISFFSVPKGRECNKVMENVPAVLLPGYKHFWLLMSCRRTFLMKSGNGDFRIAYLMSQFLLKWENEVENSQHENTLSK